MELTYFLHADANSGKLKDYWVSVVKDGHSHLVHETLKSAVF